MSQGFKAMDQHFRQLKLLMSYVDNISCEIQQDYGEKMRSIFTSKLRVRRSDFLNEN